MSQASATKLIPKLRYKLTRRRKLSTPEGPQGRHNKIKKIVTALFKHERIELNYNYADESRGYAERLISDAIRHGDCHKPTMEMASYWIVEKPIVHKLFKVLAPRFQNFRNAYTKLWHAPNVYPGKSIPKCVLELSENIYPSLQPDKSCNKNLIHNVLLEAARVEYHKEKALKTKSKINEQKVSDVGKSQSSVKENIGATVDGNIDFDRESELPSEENLKAISLSKSENEEKSGEDSFVEKDLDLRKMKIEEKKITD